MYYIGQEVISTTTLLDMCEYYESSEGHAITQASCITTEHTQYIGSPGSPLHCLPSYIITSCKILAQIPELVV
jgi:hypothetical protein